MADWTVITDSSLDPDAPLTSELAYAWRDNPIAIAEGAAGAPRILDAALGTTPTNAGRNWVAQRTVTASASGVGQYAFLRVLGSAGYNPGDTVDASVTGLQWSGSGVDIGPSVSGGVWRCQGFIASGSGLSDRRTLFLRVS